MDNKTVRRLNQLNKEFYLKTQEYFNITRQFNWAGWEKLLPHLQGSFLKVLDVGCGNGRFGKFLIDQGKKIEYIGIDSNQFLLDIAQEKLPQAKLISQDILKPIKIKEKFDLISLFGVLHHVPGRENRLKLLQELTKLLSRNGLLVFTNWHFNKFKRFNSYVIPFEKVGLSKDQMEEGDYVLDWKKGVRALRYCNLMTDGELDKIKKKLNIQVLSEYVADAKSGQGNRYVVLKR